MKKTFPIIIIALAVTYFVGPSPKTPDYSENLPNVPGPGNLVEFVSKKESGLNIKPGNEAQIVWADSSEGVKTKYAIVYLHGFTASHEEGASIHRDFAKRYGCNLYLARLSEHGIDTDEALLNYTAEGVWNSALEALAIGKSLGEKIIVMSTSTGGTLALKLAAIDKDVVGLINYSPNIEINDPAAFLLNDPWGLQIARLVFGGDYRTVESDDEYRKYWYDKYRLESIVQLQELVETMAVSETFERVKCATFNGVYYKDDENQDEVVRVSAIRKMHDELSTPDQEKWFKEFPEAKAHVIANKARSKSFPEVKAATFEFAESILKLNPIDLD